MAKAKETQLKRGQPTKYKPEYCEMLIEYMAEGKSIEAFAGKIRVCRDTIYEWINTQRDFSDAKKIGDMARHDYAETQYLKAANGKIPNANMGGFIFFNKSQLGWTDRTESINKNVEMTYEDYLKSIEGESNGQT